MSENIDERATKAAEAIYSRTGIWTVERLARVIHDAYSLPAPADAAPASSREGEATDKE